MLGGDLHRTAACLGFLQTYLGRFVNVDHGLAAQFSDGDCHMRALVKRGACFGRKRHVKTVFGLDGEIVPGGERAAHLHHGRRIGKPHDRAGGRNHPVVEA